MKTHPKMQEQMLLAKSTSRKMTQRFRYAWPIPGAERRPMWLGSSKSRDGKGVLLERLSGVDMQYLSRTILF